MRNLYLIFFISCYIQSFAQTKKINVDSIRIESLKKRLPGLTGTTRVDVFNDIAMEYAFNKRKPDSIYKYADLAYQEATKIGYKKGLAYSLFNLKGTKQERTKNKLHAKRIGEELNDGSILGWFYYVHGDSTLSQTENFKRSAAYFQKAGDEENEAEIVTWLAPMLMYEGKYEEAFPYAERSVILTKKKRTHNIDLGPVLVQFSYNNISQLYKVVGDYETALDYLQKGRKYSVENNLDWNMIAELGLLFHKAGRYDSAIYYLEKNAAENPRKPDAKILLAETYLQVKNYDESISLFKQAIDSIKMPKKNLHHFWIQTNNSLLMRAYLNMAKAFSEKKNNKAALENIKFSNSYRYGDTILVSSAESLMQDYDLLSAIYHNAGKNDSAYKYLKKYVALKDSLDNKKAMWRLNMKLSNYKNAAVNAKKEAYLAILAKDNKLKEQQLQQQILIQRQNTAQLALLNKNNEIIEQQILLKDQELELKVKSLNEQHFLRKQKESVLALLDKDNRLKDQQLEQQIIFRNTLLAGFFLFLLFGVFFFRSLSLKRKNEKLKSEKRQADLQQQSAELEMQALRAQMNPHFIFNCLSSINKFILKNESRAASDYLTRFSRLIRRVLTNSQLSMIPLNDEVEMLRLYLDMERLRFSNSFDYNIVYANEIEPESIYVPPMLLQPFCENAIWHGLMHKEGQGQLNVVMRTENNMLNCTITDNGIGREKGAELKSKSGQQQKSFGLKITTERLSLFNQQKSIDSFYKTEDVLDEEGNVSGTRVNLNIRYKQTQEASFYEAD